MKILFVLFFMVINYSVFAETVFNTTIQNGCVDVYDNKMRFETVFEPMVYNCSSGTFLPANSKIFFVNSHQEQTPSLVA